MWLTFIKCYARDTARRLIKEERAATAVEYAVIAAIVGIGLIAVMNTFSDELQETFSRLSDALVDGQDQ